MLEIDQFSFFKKTDIIEVDGDHITSKTTASHQQNNCMPDDSYGCVMQPCELEFTFFQVLISFGVGKCSVHIADVLCPKRKIYMFNILYKPGSVPIFKGIGACQAGFRIHLLPGNAYRGCCSWTLRGSCLVLSRVVSDSSGPFRASRVGF